jgi:hypothetical protein
MKGNFGIVAGLELVPDRVFEGAADRLLQFGRWFLSDGIGVAAFDAK